MTTSTADSSVQLDSSKSLVSIIQTLVDYILGYDFFIAYTRRDGSEYALALTEDLRRRGFKCFLDKSDFGAGDPLVGATHRALKKTTALILVGSPRITESGYVCDEVRTFSAFRRRIIPVDIDKTLENSAPDIELRKLLKDRIRVQENISALTDGPSQTVVGELLQSFKATRQDSKRIRVFGVVTLVFALVAAVAVLLAVKANAASRLAEERRIEAEYQKEAAVAQRIIAQRNADEAEKQRKEAVRNADEREQQRKEAERQKSLAQENEARAIQNAEEAKRQKAQAENEREKIKYGILRAEAVITVQERLQKAIFSRINLTEELVDKISEINYESELTMRELIVRQHTDILLNSEKDENKRKKILDESKMQLSQLREDVLKKRSQINEIRKPVIEENKLLLNYSQSVVKEIEGLTKNLKNARPSKKFTDDFKKVLQKLYNINLDKID